MNIPIDIPLPLPGPLGLLKILLVVTFIIHILFVGLMVGGSYWSVIFKLLAKKDPFYERLAREIMSTVTVNKSMAVVLGVAPLLLIGLAYTRYWYTANILTVAGFLSIIWLVILAFWLLYAYKYSWDSLADKPHLHIPLGALACLIFSVIPLIFLSNINLMILPFRWSSVSKFVDAMLLPNVIPRYLHFFVAAFAMTGFFAAAYFWFRGRKSEDPFFSRAQRVGLKWALTATLLQGIFGPLLFITLPQGAYSNSLFILIGVSISFIAIVCLVLIRALQRTTGVPIIAAALLLCLIALLMSFQRHLVRENLLREPHRVAEERTKEYNAALGSFLESYKPEEGTAVLSGEELFERYCSSCHTHGRRLVGPPIEYMVEKYGKNHDAMVKFVLNPSKVNPDLPSMPKPPVDETQARTIVEYLLSGSK